VSDHVLVLEGLRVSVAGTEVLRGVDLTVRSGEVHALMGPNGSGKSTLAHVLMGKGGYEVTAGAVTLDGADLLAMGTWERAAAGLFLAMQQPVEVPGVGLAQVLEATGRDTSNLAGEAQDLGLDGAIIDRSLNVDLSGGEKKRSETLQLAMLRPSIAVLDEVDTGLDVDGLRLVAGRLRRAVEEWGMGVLAITHFRRLLSVLRPDAVHVLLGGRVVESGGAELAEKLEQSGYEVYAGAAGT
jgi:Fe-S cluster assembly ATP-binding protein